MSDISKIAEGLAPAMRDALVEFNDGGYPAVPVGDRLMVFALSGSGLADFNSVNGMPLSWWLNSRGLAVREHLLKEGGE